MRPTRAIPATLVALAIVAPAADARPTIRVETVSRELVPALTSGSVRSYVDTDGALHALPARSALGQVVALGARLDVPVDVQFFSSFSSGLLQRFGSGHSVTGGWQFTVDGAPPPVGADSTVLRSNAEVVWWLVDDFATQGGLLPLDLDLVSKSSRGVVRFRVTRFDSGSGKVKGAAGATLRVAGRSLQVPASGLVSVRLKRGTRFHARATAPNSIRSDRVSGKV